jgi:hypothetical protein
MTLYANIPKFDNPVAPSSSKLRQANQTLNTQLQLQQALLTNQTETLRGAQQTILEFKTTTENMAKDRMELLKIIEGLKADHLAREAEMRHLTVYGFHLLMNVTQYMLL